MLPQKQFISQGVPDAAVGQSYPLEFTAPTGYNRITGFIFDPTQDISVTLLSQSTKTNILSGFSTAIGSAMGFIDVGYDNATNEIIQLVVTPNILTTAPKLLTFTLQFEP